ncbi:MAG: hypothetical protein K2P78_04535 [Gemmataceae bacterium]|nr:hypothetical protein [Gemmataceae bacterium]
MTAVLLPRNIELLKEGKPLVVEYRHGSPIPINVKLIYCESEEAARAWFDSLPRDPDCIDSKDPRVHPPEAETVGGADA